MQPQVKPKVSQEDAFNPRRRDPVRRENETERLLADKTNRAVDGFEQWIRMLKTEMLPRS